MALVQHATRLGFEQHEWAGGSAEGGPNGDGLYPFTAPDGSQVLVPSPAALAAGRRLVVATRDALKAAPAAAMLVDLVEPGRVGAFLWDPAVPAARHRADGCEGVYVAPHADRAGAWVRQFAGPLLLTWFGARLDFSVARGGAIQGTDDTAAWRGAIALMDLLNVGQLLVPWGETGLSRVDGPIVDGPLPNGLSFRGLRASGIHWNVPGTGIVSTGSTPCWNIRYPQGGTHGGWTFEGLSFRVTDPAGCMFALNDDAALPLKDGAGHGYIKGLTFRDCFGQGFGGAGANRSTFLRGRKGFHISVDDRCEMRDWGFAFDLTGCDNCTIGARLWVNLCDIRHVGSGTFGNDLLVNSRWIGPSAGIGPVPYAIYEEATNTVIDVSALEEITPNRQAFLYLGGLSTIVRNPAWGYGRTPLFRLGPRGRECRILQPRISVQPAAPIIDPPASTDWGYGQEVYRCRIEGAFPNVAFGWGQHERLDYRGTVRTSNGLMTLPEDPQLADARGVRARALVMTAANYFAQAIGGGVGAPPTFVADPGASGGKAICLSGGRAGFWLMFTVGINYMPGDLLKVRVRSRAGGAGPGRAIVTRTIGGQTTTILTLPRDTAYGEAGGLIDLTGLATGTKVAIHVRGLDLAAPLLIDALSFEVASPAITPLPTDGSAGNAALARAINLLIAHGRSGRTMIA